MSERVMGIVCLVERTGYKTWYTTTEGTGKVAVREALDTLAVRDARNVVRALYIDIDDMTEVEVPKL